MKLINRIVDSLGPLASDDIIEGQFIQTSLKDIYQTDQERHQVAFYDALCQDATRDKGKGKTPLGKLVR